MRLKKIIGIAIVLLLSTHIASAADSNSSDPFSPGNAKAAYDNQSKEFKSAYFMLFGLFWLALGSWIFICFGGAAGKYAGNKSGTFADPSEKAHGASSMLSILFIVLGLGLCILSAKSFFGF